MNINKLKGKLLECNMRYKDVASALGISTTAVTSKVNGKVDFKLKEVSKICSLLHLSDKERDDIFF